MPKKTTITHRKTPDPYIIKETQDNISFFKDKYLKVRDEWIEDASEYIEGTCEDIGLIDEGKRALDELCFALSIVNQGNGEKWLKNYMRGKMDVPLFSKSEEDINNIVVKINLLGDLFSHPDIIKGLKISVDDWEDYLESLLPEPKDYMEEWGKHPERLSADIYINHCTSILFRIMKQQHKNKTLKIGTNDQVQFVLNLYVAWKYREYDMTNVQKEKKEKTLKTYFNRLYTQRNRALK